jgi:hypothetical protein
VLTPFSENSTQPQAPANSPGRRQAIQVRVIDAPPSTSEAVPVTNDESSEAR